MIARYSNPVLRLLAVASLLPGLAGYAADTKETKIEARLIWATNDGKSPDTNHTAVDFELARKLQKCPLKWTNYFLVNQQQASVAAGLVKPVKMSERCTVEVKNLGNGNVEVRLLGEGKLWGNTNFLKAGDDLMICGPAENQTAWIVYLRSTSKDSLQPPKEGNKPGPAGSTVIPKGNDKEETPKAKDKPAKEAKQRAPA